MELRRRDSYQELFLGTSNALGESSLFFRTHRSHEAKSYSDSLAVVQEILRRIILPIENGGLGRSSAVCYK